MTVARFTPSMMKHEDLEAIFVQRQELAQEIVEKIRESVLNPSKHSTLLIGSRGMGKTYLVTLAYHRVRQLEECKDRLLIAWLREEEWGVTSFLDLLLRIFRALKEENGDLPVKNGGFSQQVELLYDLPPDAAERAGITLLKEVIGDRTLLLLMENLDELFEGLGKEGQKQFRSFLQKNACSILATAQSLSNSIQAKTSPFYGFFDAIHPLQDLTVDEATELLANIAKLQGKSELESFIKTSTGRDRIKAVHHLAGGNPRIYVIFSEFLTKESLAQLVEVFKRTLDDLTPYYQDRMKYLSPQQRKIVEFLCDRRHAVTVKEIAQRCFMTHQTASSQLKKLLEMSYVRSASIGRESYYELREVLMRFCFEVKKQRGEPISLIVDLLRIWYTRKELQDRLKSLLPDATDKQYWLSALGGIEEDTKDIITKYETFLTYIHKKDYVHALEAAEELVIIRGNAEDWSNKGWCLGILGRWNEALASLEKVIELEPHNDMAWANRGTALGCLECHNEALVSFEKAIDLNPDESLNWANRGAALLSFERYDEALESFEKAIKLDPNNVLAWHNRAKALSDLEYYEEALASYNKEIELNPLDSSAWSDQGRMQLLLEYYEEALASYDTAIELNPLNQSAWGGRATILFVLGYLEEALVSYDKAIELNPNQSIYWYNRGQLLSIFGRDKEALASYDKAIELNPVDPFDWICRSEVLGELQRYDEALISCDKAIELEPNYADAWFNRGWLLGELGRNEEALESCNKAIELGVQFSTVFFNRAEYLLALNRWDEGIAALDDALNRFVDAEEPDTGDEKAILRNLFNSTNDATIWRSHIKTLIELYDKHQVLSALGKGLVESIPAIMSEMVSDKAAQTWLEVWQEIVGDAKEFEIPLRLLKTAVEYKVKKGDRRVLLELPIEERKLLTEELKIEEAYKK